MAPSASIRTLALALATTAILALTPSFAQAAFTHEYKTQITEIPAEEGTGPAKKPVQSPGKLAEVQGLTVSSGDLFVGERNRLDTFSVSSDDFVSQLVPSEAEPTAPRFEGGFGVARESGEVYVGVEDAVDVFSKAGVLLGAWTGTSSEPFNGGFSGVDGVTGVAVDDSISSFDEARGDVYVAVCGLENGACVNREPGVDVFKPEANGKETYSTRIEGPCAVPTACAPGEAFTDPIAVAVDDANGYVFVVDGVVGDVDTQQVQVGAVVDIFKPEAMNTYAFVGQIAGTPDGAFGNPSGIAVDGSGVDSGDIYVADSRLEHPTAEELDAGENVVDEFKLVDPSEEATEYVGHLTGAPTGPGGSSRPFSSPDGVAVDPSSGDVFVGDHNEGTDVGAVDVFGPDLVIPDVTTEAVAGEPLPPTVTVNGTVDPDGLPVTSCTFEYGTSTAYGQSVSCEQGLGEGPGEIGKGPSPVPVSAKLAGLSPDTTYHLRLLAGDADGTNTSPDREFTAAGPGFGETSATEVTSTAATLQARIDPHGHATTYHFEYDTRPYDPGEGPHGTSVPVPEVALGSGVTPVQVAPEPIQGLTPGTVYHYRVLAASEVEPRKIVDFDGSEATFTTHTAGQFSLIDNRQWEMVSPPNKYGALVEPIEEQGPPIQAAASGDAITYHANEAIEAGPPGVVNKVQALSSRTTSGWTSRDIELPHASPTAKPEGAGETYRFFNENLSTAVLQPPGAFNTELSPEASEQTAFLRTTFFNENVGEPCLPSATVYCYEPLATGKEGYANVPVGTTFGGALEHGVRACPYAGPFCGPIFEGASPNAAHVVVKSYAQLTATKVPPPVEEVQELYEWNGGKLALVSALPEGAGPATETPDLGFQAGESLDIRHAVSDDGMSVFWSEKGEHGHLYMTDMLSGESVQLDAVRNGRGSGGVEPVFQDAAADGSRVWFTDTQQLTADSGAGNGQPDLYECEIVVEGAGAPRCELTDLTPETASGERANVQYTIVGTSENGCDIGSTEGCYVYFVANGRLSGPGSGAVMGDCAQNAPSAACNLFVLHDGVTRLVGVLSGEDAPDWAKDGAALPELTARVSPDGRWLSFMSDRDLTGYDTRDSTSGHPDEEVYLYNAETQKLVCASCDPSGGRPEGVEGGVNDGNIELVGAKDVWAESSWLAANIPGWTPFKLSYADYQSRYLSNSGRLFFNSHDALVPRDVNGQWDVYEYEPEGVPENAHACSPQSTSGSSTYKPAHTAEVEGRKVTEGAGCVGLISSGASAEESAFLDASESGGDVFFLTTGKLESQDYDNAFDIYDAHECTSSSPCFPPPGENPPACETAEACRGAQAPQPGIFGQPPSATFNGQGNLGPVAKPAVKKPLTRAQKLAAALKVCRRDKRKGKRVACEKAARKRYGPVTKAKKRK